jgi:hypothetical protein
MAARLNKRHDEQTRSKIQTSQLINRLNDHAFGKVEMTPAQVRSAEILLKKSIPDLKSIEHSGPEGGAIPISYPIKGVTPEPREDGDSSE